MNKEELEAVVKPHYQRSHIFYEKEYNSNMKNRKRILIVLLKGS